MTLKRLASIASLLAMSSNIAQGYLDKPRRRTPNWIVQPSVALRKEIADHNDQVALKRMAKQMQKAHRRRNY